LHIPASSKNVAETQDADIVYGLLAILADYMYFSSSAIGS
jgi:hypothetical protein